MNENKKGMVVEMRVPGTRAASDAPQATRQEGEKASVGRKISIGSFILGLTSIFFHFIGAVPIGAIVLGIWGIVKTRQEGATNWMAIAGLVLGVVYLLANANMYGHL